MKSKDLRKQERAEILAKIQSAIEYVEKGGKEAIITSQDNITKCMLQPECCTRIVPD